MEIKLWGRVSKINKKGEKMKRFKKIFAILLTSMFVLGFNFPVPAFAMNVGDTFQAVIDGKTTTFKVLSVGNDPTVEISGIDIPQLSALSIPPTVTYQNETFAITYVGIQAFRFKNNLTSVIMPEGLTRLRDYAFNGCANLASVTIPSSVTTFNANVFQSCFKLEEVISLATTSQNVNMNSLFQYVDLSYVDLYVPIGTIQDYINAGWIGFGNYYEIYGIGDTFATPIDGLNATFKVLSIGNNPTVELIGIDIPKLSALNMPSTVLYQGKTYSIVYIGIQAFRFKNNLTSVVMPEGLTRLRDYAFNGCANLISVTIPSSVTKIDANIFQSCFKLEEVTSLAATPLNANMGSLFQYVDLSYVDLYVPIGTTQDYINAGWTGFRSIIEI